MVLHAIRGLTSMGRCDTSTNNACDEDEGVTFGYSCTDATCTVVPFRDWDDGFSRRGSVGWEPGQFNGPAFIALDPKGVLYVSDGGEPNAGGRVQRFASDGTFGGEARSTGTGVNQGERPGFILGNLGTVKAVSVNSTHFFVVDQDESFVHVFETTPLKDITNDSATIVQELEVQHPAAKMLVLASKMQEAETGDGTNLVVVLVLLVLRIFRPCLLLFRFTKQPTHHKIIRFVWTIFF